MYLWRLVKVDAWLAARGWEPIQLAGPEVIELYLADLDACRTSPVAPASRRVLCNAVRTWIRYARQIGLLAPIPVLPEGRRKIIFLRGLLGRKGLSAIFTRKATVIRYRALPLGALLDGFVEALFQEGYRCHAIQVILISFRGFAEFLAARGAEPERLADASFISDYISLRSQKAFQDKPQKRPGALECRIRHSAKLVVAYARRMGLLPLAPPARQNLPGWVNVYLDYLAEHRGLKPCTLAAYRGVLRQLSEFLGESGGSKVELEWETLEDFICQLGRKFQRRTLYSAMAALRGLLRFRFMIGEDSEDRSGWLDFPTVYREENLPHFLSEIQLQEALRSVDRSRPAGQRDWAVLLLLSTYGFRPGEVARLRLAELDFERGRLLVRRLKGGKEQWVPMTPPIREALLEYQKVRPKTEIPELFLTLNAPLRKFCSGGTLAGTCVYKYLQRVPGLQTHGAYALRHTVARRLRRQGATVAEVRSLLGHVQDADTTARYLRIALEELREVAGGYADLL